MQGQSIITVLQSRSVLTSASDETAVSPGIADRAASTVNAGMVWRNADLLNEVDFKKPQQWFILSWLL
jgi:hypothetical protein